MYNIADDVINIMKSFDCDGTYKCMVKLDGECTQPSAVLLQVRQGCII